MVQFSLDVSYNQVFVYAAGLEDPFNDWSDEPQTHAMLLSRENVGGSLIADQGEPRSEAGGTMCDIGAFE